MHKSLTTQGDGYKLTRGWGGRISRTDIALLGHGIRVNLQDVHTRQLVREGNLNFAIQSTLLPTNNTIIRIKVTITITTTTCITVIITTITITTLQTEVVCNNSSNTRI
jgi:hypothetical protein